MTDYSTMTKEQLLSAQQQHGAERDSALTEMTAIQDALDLIAIKEEAAAEVAEMSDEEKAAMQQALQG